MLTLTLQCASAVLALAFGLASLAISRYESALTPDRRAGWRLTGIGFTLLGASAALQNAWAVPAFFSGEGTAVYDTFVRWAPAMNHSRTFLGVAYALLMTGLAWSGRFPERGFWVGATLGMLAAAGAGGVLGGVEGAFEMTRHGPAVAVLLTVEMIGFCVVLLVSAVRGTFDLFLFASLMLYGLMMALSVPLWTGMSLAEVIGVRAPPPWLLKLQTTLFTSAMLGLAALRLVLLRRGVRVHEAFGRQLPLRIRFFPTSPP